MTQAFDQTKIDWAKTEGLIPAVVQDQASLRVLMLGYMNKEALKQTLDTGLVTFYSRSKHRIWQKGEASGHVLKLKSIKLDCDGDTFLVAAEPEGPTCHLGTTTCFGDDETASLSILADLAKTIRDRRKAPQSGSYTTKLFASGIPRIAQKVGEEGVEVALAASAGGEGLASEAADLVYHLWVLLEACDVNWRDVMEILRQRARAKK
jgi:phosphoribosyl-ATP pyrophosphohydrolase/phosphoribosyl-AMP cyclohydrolase